MNRKPLAIAAMAAGAAAPVRVPSSSVCHEDWAVNGLAIDKRAGAELRTISHRLNHLVNHTNPAMSSERKVIRIQAIADKAFSLIQPNTPCKAGCSHCCNIAVGISEVEARIISKHIGRPYVQQQHNPTDAQDTLHKNVMRYRETPCTFLVEGRCSIYAVRPIACRTHHSIAATSSNCDVSQGVQDVPMIDLKGIAIASVVVAAGGSFGDIRAFFPPASNRGDTDRVWLDEHPT